MLTSVVSSANACFAVNFPTEKNSYVLCTEKLHLSEQNKQFQDANLMFLDKKYQIMMIYVHVVSKKKTNGYYSIQYTNMSVACIKVIVGVIFICGNKRVKQLQVKRLISCPELKYLFVAKNNKNEIYYIIF